jgi:hypothetical protein
MPKAICPVCEGWVHVEADADMFDRVHCPDCGATLEITDVEPFELSEVMD